MASHKDMENGNNVNWTQFLEVLGYLVAILSTGLTVCVVYLRLFIGSRLGLHKEAILTHIDEKFALKDTMDRIERDLKEDMFELKRRLDRVENGSRGNT
jgi:hypothetical protein